MWDKWQLKNIKKMLRESDKVRAKQSSSHYHYSKITELLQIGNELKIFFLIEAHVQTERG